MVNYAAGPLGRDGVKRADRTWPARATVHSYRSFNNHYVSTTADTPPLPPDCVPACPVETARRLGHSVETLVSTYVGALVEEEHIANQCNDIYLDTTLPTSSVGPDGAHRERNATRQALHSRPNNPRVTMLGSARFTRPSDVRFDGESPVDSATRRGPAANSSRGSSVEGLGGGSTASALDRSRWAATCSCSSAILRSAML